MQARTFMKGAVAGGVGATAVLAATAAIAGTGVGGVFNLGQTNTVDATSTLSGNTSGAAQLQVTNNGTGAGSSGIGVNVPSGKSPFAINSDVLVTNLNADRVDNYHANQLTRLGHNAPSGSQLSAVGTESDLQTVTVKAPTSGYALVTAQATAYDNGTCAAWCSADIYIRSETSVRSPVAYDTFTGSSYPSQYQVGTLTRTWVVPVTSGTHTYTLVGGTVTSDDTTELLNWYDAQITGEFKPFNWQGTKTGPLHP